jgi:hypothetical protein
MEGDGVSETWDAPGADDSAKPAVAVLRLDAGTMASSRPRSSLAHAVTTRTVPASTMLGPTCLSLIALVFIINEGLEGKVRTARFSDVEPTCRCRRSDSHVTADRAQRMSMWSFRAIKPLVKT